MIEWKMHIFSYPECHNTLEKITLCLDARMKRLKHRSKKHDFRNIKGYIFLWIYSTPFFVFLDYLSRLSDAFFGDFKKILRKLRMQKTSPKFSQISAFYNFPPIFIAKNSRDNLHSSFGFKPKKVNLSSRLNDCFNM